VIIMLCILPFVLLCSLAGKVKGGNLIYRLLNLWARIWYPMAGIRHREIYEAPHDKHIQYMFVANHSSYMDIPPIVKAIHQPVRILGKYELGKIPLFGFIYRQAAVTVNRSSAAERAKSVNRLKHFIQQGISVFIFPEGTFNETGQPLKSFYDGAFRIAIETGLPIKPLLFVDNLERMHYKGILNITPGKSRVVFLQEISTKGYTMETMQQLKALVYQKMEEGLRRYRTTF
jgi:1-acyl-sn-glycerol-3-phosphate acyltransferase